MSSFYDVDLLNLIMVMVIIPLLHIFQINILITIYQINHVQLHQHIIDMEFLLS